MVTFNLDKIFNPASIAVIGATEKEGSVGATLMKNLLELGFKGKVFPVNIKKQPVYGKKTYSSVLEIDEPVDLAIIAVPAKAVPDVLEECGKKNIKGIIIISAGFKEAGEEGKLLYNRIEEIKEKYKLRIIGPNCLGIIRPSIKLNASFAPQMPKSGRIAFISQSGALGSAILDWAIHHNIGFSNFVSLGSMLDVDFGDLIDYFGEDPLTKSILIYMEGLTNARKFMSAARHFARTKPIIIVKSGKYAESAKAAASHTGALAGEDLVFEAAFKRAGIVRVDEIEDLFNCAEVLGMQPLPKGPRLAIITNAGGPGVMATDALIAKGGQLAKISDHIMEKLNSFLPPYWSKSNPLDILGDATAERYKKVVEACLYDDNIDGILVIYTPQGPAKPEEIANVIVELTKSSEYPTKTILTSFIGYESVANANKIFLENNIPTYPTPEQAVKTYMYMYQYKRNLELLYETPEELPTEVLPPKRPLYVIMRNAARENRERLDEYESKRFLEYYGIPVAKTIPAASEAEAVNVATQIGYPVVMKILSPQITHKSDVGGVILNIKNEVELRSAYQQIIENVKKYKPDAEIYGVTISPMINFKGTEVILGAKKDPLFGPVILFGMGGIGVELFKDVNIGLPPLNATLAKRIIEETKVYRLLKGFRNIPPANIRLLEEAMVKFSNMLIDFPQIKEVDINPLLVGSDKICALDARIIIDPSLVYTKFERHEHLVISPYPKKYEQMWKLNDGTPVLLRPIKPEDEPLWLEMFQSFSEETIKFRFFQIIKDMPHEVRVRYCNNDYDRELAIVADAVINGKRRILGVVRLNLEPDGKTGEIAFVVADQWQGLGLGSKLVDFMIEICKDKNIETIYAIMLKTNYRAQSLLRKMGFTLEKIDEETVRGVLNLKEEYLYEQNPPANLLNKSSASQSVPPQRNVENAKTSQETRRKTAALKEQLKQKGQAVAESA